MKQHRAALDEKLAKVGRKPRDVGILWSIRIQVAESEADAKEKERRYLASIRPEAGLVEMSAQYNVDFSKAKPGMRLADFAGEVLAQKGNYGSFEELLKTTDPSQTVEEFGRRFLVDRILVAAGTMGGSSWAAAIRRWTTSASLSSLSFRSSSGAVYPKPNIPGQPCAKI
jgi:alkanesulfonate monooxygenase SsuD/methylene tetrahydromethanopterin reductase-like flavin-dependent oxidoreductase (luciferase family)